MDMSMCGYRCDQCKANGDNIVEKDERDAISRVWHKYYDITIEPIEIYCDGCNCMAKDADRMDSDCPVRACVLNRDINSCAECDEWPCETWNLRKGMNKEEAAAKLGEKFDAEEFDEYLSAFDNETRILQIKKMI